jgi:hypothetical protein
LVALAFGLLATGLSACDIPTSGPSLETETGISGPVVVNKTFLLLGGPESPEEALIDTTTSEFDSLFTVSEEDQSLSIEEEVSSFDIGSLDEALGEATEGIGTSTSFSEPIIEGSSIESQEVSVSAVEENDVPPASPPNSESVPVPDEPIPFPSALLAVPEFEVGAVTADSVRRGTLTSEKMREGTRVNQVTFRLENNGGAPLANSEGDSPTVTLRGEEGTLIREDAPFSDGPIAAGETESVSVEVQGQTLGQNAEVELAVVGNDPQDRLDIELSPLRYQRATLADVSDVSVTASLPGISARGGETAFAGVSVREGTLELGLTNNLSFPIQADDIALENSSSPALPEDFPELNVSEESGVIQPGDTETISVDLTGRGIADEIDLEVQGTSPGPPDPIDASASGSIQVSADGELGVEELYFWPSGESVQASGQFDFETDRLSFSESGTFSSDFVELDTGTLSLDNFQSEPEVGFEAVTLSFPSIRRPPYDPADSVVTSFPVPPASSPEIEPEGLSDAKISPAGNAVRYSVEGTLETIEEENRSESNLRVVRFGDAISTGVSVEGLDVRALSGDVNPFSVDVTEDADGNGRLDLADDQEASKESFGDFGDIAGRVEDLSLAGTQLDFRIDTDVGTDAQIYAALRGEGGTRPAYLSGRGENAVGPEDPLGEDLVRGGTPIPLDNLIQFGVEGASGDSPATRTISLTDENSTVDDFVSALPASLRFVAQARLMGDETGRIRLRRPLQFEAGLSASIPVRLNSSFQVRDTVDADFSALEDVTGGDDDVTISEGELRVRYENAVPLGAEVNLAILDENGAEVLSLPSGEETVRLRPAPKSGDGTSSSARTGSTTLSLSETEVRDLAGGRRLILRATLDQENGSPAVLRATDTIQLALEAKVNASVSVD